jgi:S-layer homology domain
MAVNEVPMTRLAVRTAVALVFCAGSIVGQEAAASRTWGTTAVSYARVPAGAFYPALSNAGYGTAAFILRRWSNTGGALLAPVALPSGASIVSLRFEFEDEDENGSIHATLLACPFGEECSEHPSAGAGPPDCLSPGVICSGVAFAGGLSFQIADLSPDEVTVDNFNDSYYVQVNGSDSSRPLAGIVVGYVLQVTPAPGAATFNDVPTGHRFFQFVEALSASGITAGCAGGNFCPDQPLTRGQMAVFLAKALGLHWP